MEPDEKAKSYLDRHEHFVDAMRALLNDLESARQTGRRDEERLLCEALIALREAGRSGP